MLTTCSRTRVRRAFAPSRSSTKRSARQETGLFLLEGPQAVARGARLPPRHARRAVRDADGARAPRRSRARPPATPASRSSSSPRRVLDAMADTVTPQGIVAVARQFPTSVRDVFAASPAARRDPRRGARPRQSRARSSGRRMPRAPMPSSSPAARSTSTTPRSCARRPDRSSTCRSRSASISTTAVERAHAAGVQRPRRRRQGRRLPRRARGAARRADGLAVRQRGARARRRAARARRPVAHGCRSTGSAESMNLATAASRLPVRERVRAARRGSTA